MNKEQYLSELKSQLKSFPQKEIIDILAEYEEHFNLKIAEGYSEEEVSARLGSPKEIAEQFKSSGENIKSSSKPIMAIGLVILDIFVVLFFIFLAAWVIVLGAFTIACAALGICLIGGLNIAKLIPYVPYAGALIIGISSSALAVLSAVGTIYCYLVVKQLIKAYIDWHKRVYSGKNHVATVSKYPQISNKSKRYLKNITLISLCAFAVTFIIGLIVLIILADFQAPWHHWNWFVIKESVKESIKNFKQYNIV